MKKIFCFIAAIVCAGNLSAQTFTYTDEDQWKAYEAFNAVFLDTKKYIYRDHSARQNAVDRWGGAAAIWCQATFYDMVVNAYQRAKAENDSVRMTKYRVLATRIYTGEKNQYCSFDFHNNNTNTGWFVYDDIMWWTCALARSYETFGTAAHLSFAEKSFCRVWYGSQKVGDDGSYADPARGLGGGMFWEWQPIEGPKPHKPGDFRSACINFPTVIAACLLHNNVPEGRTAPTGTHPTQQTKGWYLEKAIEVFNWAHTTLVQNGRVADGIHGGGPEFNDHLYNQATYIGAACHLYLITGERKYLNYANQAANYVFNTMCGGSTRQYLLPLETGVEQGIYAAIFAQYLHVLVYDCGQTRYLNYVKRNIQRAWTNMDHSRGIHDGNFRGKTTEGAQIESYNASGLPALMLMFPMGDSQTGITKPNTDRATLSDVYSLEGKLIRKKASPEEVENLHKGIYIYNRHKTYVQ